MRANFLTKVKSIFRSAALVATFAFAYQSAALPIHAAAHAARTSVESGEGFGRNFPRFLESECDLCSLATHQAIQIGDAPTFDACESVTVRAEFIPPARLPLRLAVLPPVRGPPARA